MTNGISNVFERDAARFAIQLAIDGAKVTLFHKLKVREILWGYNDNLLGSLKKVEDLPFLKKLKEFLKKYFHVNVLEINPFVQLQVSCFFFQ